MIMKELKNDKYNQKFKISTIIFNYGSDQMKNVQKTRVACYRETHLPARINGVLYKGRNQNQNYVDFPVRSCLLSWDYVYNNSI